MAAVVASRAGISRRKSPSLTSVGRMKAVTPRISPRFAMFEPITFPSAMPLLPWFAATTPTTSSGAEVP